MMELNGRQIGRALIVDDEQDAREAYEYVVEDMELEPVKVEGPLDDISEFLEKIQPADVVICDFHLKKHAYASWDGNRLVRECFKAKIPSVLCTANEDPPIRRDFLRYIPGFLRTGNPEPTELNRAWGKCVRELEGRFEPDRRPWRTLVRIADVDPDHQCVYVVVPAWNVHQKVRIDIDNLPPTVQKLIEPDRRFHALVNTGAKSHRELFFDDWELK